MTNKEKIIYEFRFFETEDGFRFEFNGDKDHLKNMGFEPGMGQNSCFGWGMGHFQKHRGRYKKHWRKHGRGFSPPWSWWWDNDDEPEEGPKPPNEKA